MPEAEHFPFGNWYKFTPKHTVPLREKGLLRIETPTRKDILMLPKIVFIAGMILTTSALSALAQPQSTTPLQNAPVVAAPATPQQPPAVDTPASTAPDFARSAEGTILANYENKELLLKSGSDYLVIHLTDEQQKIGFSRGNLVAVKGQAKPDSLLGNEILAGDIKVLKNEKSEEDPLLMASLPEVEEFVFAKGNVSAKRLIALRGVISDWNLGSVTLMDGGKTIRVDLNRADPSKTFAKGEEVVVIGRLERIQSKMVLYAVWIRPISFLLHKDEPKEVQTILATLKADERGKLVKVRGRIALFIGAVQNGTLIYEGENVMIVYPSEKYLSLDAPAGAEVVVVGRYDAEIQRGRSYGVLRDARIDRLALAQVRN